MNWYDMENTKYKILSEVTFAGGNLPFDIKFYLFLGDYGYTPYKVNQMYSSLIPAHDFWFSALKKKNAVDMVEGIVGFDVDFWLAYKKGKGLYVFAANKGIENINFDMIYNKIVEEGKLLLTEPEFNIHARLQEKYFKNEKEMEWD
jgi:hypothetical protein